MPVWNEYLIFHKNLYDIFEVMENQNYTWSKIALSIKSLSSSFITSLFYSILFLDHMSSVLYYLNIRLFWSLSMNTLICFNKRDYALNGFVIPLTFFEMKQRCKIGCSLNHIKFNWHLIIWILHLYCWELDVHSVCWYYL